MKLLKLIPDDTHFPFVRFRKVAYALSAALLIASLALLFTRGLNFGIDFTGGVMVEIETEGPADLGDLRGRLGGLGLGDVQIQTFGAPNDVLIRVGQNVSETDGEEQAAVRAIKAELGDSVTYRRVEVVGPQVGDELIRDATIAVLLSLALMLLYIWIRFEWQFSLGAILALGHDVLLTMGVFSLLQFEFNLSTIAALLTIVGYSMNDTVVVYDRVRENLRRFKRMPLEELLDLSINDTLSRTVITAVTTLIALIALFIFGGEVIRGFTFAMIFGIVVGTYSSIFVAAPVLLAFGVKRDWSAVSADNAKASAKN